MPYAIREALAAFRRAPLLTGLSSTMIGLSLFAIGLFGIAAHNIRIALERVESRVEVVAYLRDDAPPEAVELARSEIASFPEVRQVLYISRDQALEIARQELAEMNAVFSGLDFNPLPASLELRLKPGQRDEKAVQAVAERVAAYPFVEEVQYGRDWLDKVYLLRRVAGAAAIVLGAAFAIVAAVIIGAAVRMAVFARREEIVVMRLVGATNGFIRRPFLLEGLITGLAGGLIALACTYGVFRILSGAVFRLVWIPDLWVAGGLVAGAVMGVLSSGLSVRRHLREI